MSTSSENCSLPWVWGGNCTGSCVFQSQDDDGGVVFWHTLHPGYLNDNNCRWKCANGECRGKKSGSRNITLWWLEVKRFKSAERNRQKFGTTQSTNLSKSITDTHNHFLLGFLYPHNTQFRLSPCFARSHPTIQHCQFQDTHILKFSAVTDPDI